MRGSLVVMAFLSCPSTVRSSYHSAQQLLLSAAADSPGLDADLSSFDILFASIPEWQSWTVTRLNPLVHWLLQLAVVRIQTNNPWRLHLRPLTCSNQVFNASMILCHCTNYHRRCRESLLSLHHVYCQHQHWYDSNLDTSASNQCDCLVSATRVVASHERSLVFYPTAPLTCHVYWFCVASDIKLVREGLRRADNGCLSSLYHLLKCIK